MLFQNWASGNHSNPECRLCSRKMLLVGQIYAPLDNSINHRSLYQFCCINNQCYGKSGTWICLRDEIKDQPMKCAISPTPTTQTCDTFWGDDADDWSDSETDEYKNQETNNHFAIENLSIVDSNISSCDVAKKQNDEQSAYAELETETEESISVEPPLKPTEDIRNLFNPTIPSIPESAITEFTSFYLNVMEEQLRANQKLDLRAKELLTEYQSKENCDLQTLLTSAAKNASKDREDYEKSLPSHGDELVHKFITRVQSCPEQLIRYNREGSPLLLQSLKECLPQCRYCGCKLVYEMQLMPHLSQRLKLVDSQHDGSLTEYGTVLIFTCSKSCWNIADFPHEEYVVVQSDMF